MGDSLQVHLNALKKLIAPIDRAVRLKPDDPESSGKVRDLIKKFPDGRELDAAIQSLSSELDQISGRQVEVFKRSVAEFVNESRRNGKYIKEGNESWRVGPVEIQLQSERARLRCLYNKEVVVDWRTVQSGREAQTAFQDAIKLLKDSELQNREVILSVALKRLVGYRTFDGAPDPKRVPIKDFYKEVRTELLRRQLDRKGALGKPISNDLPLWVFLYNLDRQLRCSAEEGGPALFVETGSQAEHAKGWALTLNGLDARNDYKQYCFVKPTR